MNRKKKGRIKDRQGRGIGSLRAAVYSWIEFGGVSDDMLVEGFFTAVDAEAEHFLYVGWFV